jgi:hypothetical protein
MTTFEAPIQEGPLDNPEWTEEQNRRFDKLQETLTTAAARRIVLGGAASAEVIDQPSEEATLEKAPPSKKSKRPINQPSRNFRIYDRDKSVSDYYDSIDPLKG